MAVDMMLDSSVADEYRDLLDVFDLGPLDVSAPAPSPAPSMDFSLQAASPALMR